MKVKTPRFLFSDPPITKTPGPFIVHCRKPAFVCRIIDRLEIDLSSLRNYHVTFAGFTVELIEVFVEHYTYEKVSLYMHDMINWIKAQPELSKYYYNSNDSLG